jgi:hypothetical protein
MQKWMMTWVLVAAMSAAATAHAGTLRCKVEKKIWCAKDGCKESQGSQEFNIVDLSAATYNMCNEGKHNCQSIPISDVGKSGIFMVVKFGGAALFKVALEDEKSVFNVNAGDFIEVRDNMLGAMNSFGTCAKMQ